jgi:uncharacterized protein (DUF2147 family)
MRAQQTRKIEKISLPKLPAASSGGPRNVSLTFFMAASIPWTGTRTGVPRVHPSFAQSEKETMRGVRLVGSVVGAILALSGSFGGSLAATSGGQITGLWLTDKRDGIVEIKPCGNLICGRIRSILLTHGQKKPIRDIQNQDPKLRSRPVCGLQVLGNLQKTSANTWGNGWVYDPTRGKTFHVEVALSRPNALSVHGYVGIKVLGETVTWTRASADVPRCK